MPTRIPVGRGFPSIEQIVANPYVLRSREKGPVLEIGLDLSSTCIGWVVAANRKPFSHGKIVFKTGKEFIGARLHCWAEYLDALIQTYVPTRLVIERPLSRRANTTGRHFELLGVTRKVWIDHTGLEIPESWIISPRTVKAALMVEPGNNHDENKKIMVNKINHLYGLGLRYASTALNSDDDIADAYAVLTTYWRRNARI